MNAFLLAALAWMPRVDAAAEVAYEIGLDEQMRATIRLMIDLDLVAGEDWQLGIFHETRTFVRSNDRRYETLFRISPEQIHYPVGARLRFDLDSAGHGWGLVAFHQSNHDVDSFDEIQARETVAYELYGAEYYAPWGLVWGGLLYDRGTRAAVDADGDRRLVRQGLPFDYYLAGVIAEGEFDVWRSAYVGGRLALFGHLGEEHAPPYLNVDGWLDAGWRLEGAGGAWRFFARFQRVEDYQHLGDEPRHLLLLGTALGTR